MLQVKHGAATVGGSSHPATFEAVYDLAGPTYPGDCLDPLHHVIMHRASILAAATAHTSLRGGHCSMMHPTSFPLV